MVKNTEYLLLNLLLLLERINYYYDALPGISVYICYYNRKNQGKPGERRTETSMLSSVSTCDISGFSEENVSNVMNERQIKKKTKKVASVSELHLLFLFFIYMRKSHGASVVLCQSCILGIT